MKKLLYTGFSLFLFLSCKEKVPEPTGSIEPQFQPYFDKFIEEGEKRGVTFTAEQKDITIQTSNVPREMGNFAGWFTTETKTIDIIPDWQNWPDQVKETLILHELGHLMLDRKHSFARLTNGEYRSLMHTSDSNIDECSAPLFTGNLRKEYYLDELFNINTGEPFWAKENTAYQEAQHSPEAIVINKGDWQDNETLQGVANTTGPNKFSYQLLDSGMSFKVEEMEEGVTNLRIPLSVLFPVLNETTLENYEIHFRYKLYGQGFEMGWSPNNSAENIHSVISNSCTGESVYMSVSNNRGGSFVNYTTIQNLTDFNDLILQHKDNYIKIWLNGNLIFQSDIASADGSGKAEANLYFGKSQFDFEYITVTRL